jgi:cobalt-precorrin-7 (C5)-methyltransferase
MRIVGVGCGPGMLTEEAIAAIREARVVFGSGRAIECAAAYIPAGAEVHRVSSFDDIPEGGAGTVVLSTGDPMLSGLGYLVGDVIPGISSLQVASARLRVPLARIAMVDAHGRDHAGACRKALSLVMDGQIVFMLTEPGFDIPALSQALSVTEGVRIAVCERLGYPDERIAYGTPQEPPVPRSGLYVLMCGRF